MTTLSFILIVLICAGLVAIVINKSIELNSKSKIAYTDNKHLYDRQELFDSLIEPTYTYVEKPKSALRGVRNKRFKKK